MVEPKPQSERQHWINANEINHFGGKDSYYNFSYGDFRYFTQNSQYIVGNSDQVRVKYIV